MAKGSPSTKTIEALRHEEAKRKNIPDSDLQEVYDTERHLLYVACTRARDFLLVTSVAPASEFLDDIRMETSFKKA